MNRVVLPTVLVSASLTACLGPTPVGAHGTRVASYYQGQPFRVGSPAGSTPAPNAAPTVVTSHTVVAGETLWRISRRYGTTVAALQKLNDIDDVTRVPVGTKLSLPRDAQAPAQKQTPRLKRPSSPTKKKKPAPAVSPSRRYRFRWPVRGTITSRFGRRWGRGHDGIDIGAPTGTEVVAAGAGTVLFASRHGTYGHLVVVKHRDNLVTVYAHNSRNLVRKGQQVRAGQLIARVGQSGRATGPHLHFEVRRGTQPVNPLKFLPP